MSVSHLVCVMFSEKLLEANRHTEAALCLEQYAKVHCIFHIRHSSALQECAVLMSVCCQDCEEAISALIQGSAWEEALRLVSLFFYASFFICYYYQVIMFIIVVLDYLILIRALLLNCIK